MYLLFGLEEVGNRHMDMQGCPTLPNPIFATIFRKYNWII